MVITLNNEQSWIRYSSFLLLGYVDKYPFLEPTSEGEGDYHSADEAGSGDEVSKEFFIFILASRLKCLESKPDTETATPCE